jgi:hypothetical protein
MKIRFKYSQKDTETVYVSVKDFLSVYWKWVVVIFISLIYFVSGIFYLIGELV